MTGIVLQPQQQATWWSQIMHIHVSGKEAGVYLCKIKPLMWKVIHLVYRVCSDKY